MRLALLLSAAALAACAALPPEPPPGAAEQHCPVCRDRRDFDCLIVDAAPRTPHTAYAGRTHYFCSTGCQCEFQRHPARYLPAR
jgi:YHS domain-containing protein